MSVAHCVTCTCFIDEDPDPQNTCEIEDIGCSGEDPGTVMSCYSCGTSVCRGLNCSYLVRYKLIKNRWVRMCATCIENRAAWGDLTDLKPEDTITQAKLIL